MDSRSIMGVGINDAEYVLTKTKIVDGKITQVWRCPFYNAWKSMLTRCYSKRFKSHRKSYSDCFVCEDWLTFSNFRLWMETQDWEGKQLDKDILIPGNKQYSPESCVFVSPKVNTFILDRSKYKGDYPTGVYFNKRMKVFVAQCSNSTGTTKFIGFFDTPEEAHRAWKEEKYRLAIILLESESIKDERIREAILSRYR